MRLPCAGNPDILGHDSFAHGSTHATNDVAWLHTWHGGVISKFERKCLECRDFWHGLMIADSFCQTKINKAKCNEALIFHHHDVATY